MSPFVTRVSPVRLTALDSAEENTAHGWRGGGRHYARGMTTSRQRGDPDGKASMHLNNLLHRLTHLHMWALPSHWGTMIHSPAARLRCYYYEAGWILSLFECTFPHESLRPLCNKKKEKNKTKPNKSLEK